MKKHKLLMVIAGIVFFLAALTFYLNRVVFPVQIKKIAVAQAENFLKRKVEIEALHFNWVKGFVVDKIKIYQKDSDQVFLQAQRVSFGIIFIPGIKQHKITIPFINIEGPSAHLIRTGNNQWNFSDLLAASPSKPGKPEEEKPSPVAVALAGIHITDGKLRLDDISEGKTWTELLDQINLKVGLSYKGISFDLSAAIPQKQGLLSTQGVYQPLNQEIEAQVRVKNLKPGEYLAFVPPINGFELKNGLVQDVNMDISYSKEGISAKGDLAIKDIQLTLNGQSIAGTIAAHNTDFIYKNGPLSAKGDFQISNAKVAANGIEAGGDLHADIHQMDINKDAMTIDGSFTAKDTLVRLSPQHIIKGTTITLDKIKARRGKEEAQIVGTFMAKGLDVHWDAQSVSGDLTLRPVTIQMKNENDITVTGDLKARHLAAADTGKSFQGDISIDGIDVHVTNTKDIAFAGKVSIDDMKFMPIPDTMITGGIGVPSLSINWADDTLSLKSKGELNNWQINLGQDKTVVMESSFTVDAIYPVKDPGQMRYNGTLAVHHAEARGFPFGPFKEINLDAEFKTEAFNLKSFSLVALETGIKGAGTVTNFKAPALNLEASCERIDLAKLKNALPDIFNQYGLETSGEASFNIQFQGLASDPLSGKINAKADLRNANASSSKFNQSVSNVSGTVISTLNSLSWNNFTGTYLGKAYTLTGSLTDFKNPKVKTTLDGQDVQLKVDLDKKDDLLTINALNGKYLNITFGGTGNVTLPPGKEPVLDINGKASLHVEDLMPFLSPDQRKNIEPLKVGGLVNIDAAIKGRAQDWKNWTANAKIESPLISVMGYTINNITLAITQNNGKVSNLTVDATAYDGKIHLVGSGDVSDAAMPFDLALNVDGLDLHKLKMDTPNLRSEEINGKFYLTTVGKGTVADIKSLQAKGSLAIREGFLTEFKLFKGLLGVLNEALRLGQVMITDVEGNFIIENQKFSTDNLRLKSPTIVLLTEGWVNFDQYCDLNVVVDMTSGIVPAIAEEVLRTLKIHIYDKIANPKYDKKISVPQVINSIIKTIGIFQ